MFVYLCTKELEEKMPLIYKCKRENEIVRGLYYIITKTMIRAQISRRAF